jgi:peroxiredoxin family protein
MSLNAPPASAEIQAAVAAEVERQVAALRAEIDAKIAEVRDRTVDDAATIVVFSGDLDKVLAAFVIATGAAAAGLETSMFFTFWGLSAIKKKGVAGGEKNLMARMFSLMTPGSSESLPTSKMNYFGMGAVMLRKMMKDQQIASLEELMAMAADLNVKLIACTMSMDAMSIGKDELIGGLTYGGVATYMSDAVRSRVTLFI